MHDAFVLVGFGLIVLILAFWNAMRSMSVIGSDVRLSPEREADFDQEWP